MMIESRALVDQIYNFIGQLRDTKYFYKNSNLKQFSSALDYSQIVFLMNKNGFLFDNKQQNCCFKFCKVFLNQFFANKIKKKKIA